MEKKSLEECLELKMTQREMADKFNMSQTNIRYWLNKYGLESVIKRSKRITDISKAPKQIQKDCSRHGLTEYVLQSRGYYRCNECIKQAVNKRRRKIKIILVQEAGGKCIICKYNKCIRSLQFHHLNPSDKAFGLSRQGVTRSISRAREEASKCVLLCSNCHGEVEHGVTDLNDYLK